MKIIIIYFVVFFIIACTGKQDKELELKSHEEQIETGICNSHIQINELDFSFEIRKSPDTIAYDLDSLYFIKVFIKSCYGDLRVEKYRKSDSLKIGSSNYKRNDSSDVVIKNTNPETFEYTEDSVKMYLPLKMK